MALYPTLLASTVETRILTLTRIDPLQGQLEVVDINGARLKPYTALSYTWKDPLSVSKEDANGWRPSMPNTIEINNESLPITLNLGNALRYLFQRNERRLWIDAICINQDDDLERSDQIGLMGRIYTQAKKVVVWLGPHADNSEMAMELLAYLATPRSPGVGIPAWLLPLCKPSFFTHWKALYHLLHRNWFKRAWVIQEVVLAREIELACGDALISERQLDEIQHVLTWYWFAVFREPTIRSTSMTSRDLERLLSPLRMRFYIQRGRPIGCLASLWLTKDTIASDPRDLLFAKYGLIGPKALQLCPPDYTISFEQACTEFAWTYIQKEQDLSIICCAGIPLNERRSTFPTWLPDWGPSKPSYPLRCSWGNGTAEWPRWKASGDTLPSVQLLSNRRILEAEGVFVDAVDGMQFDPWCKRESEYREGAQSKSHTSAFCTQFDAFTALYRTVVADTHRREVPLQPVQAEAEFGRLFVKACLTCDQLLDELQEPLDHIPSMPREGASNIEKRWHGMRHLQLGGCSLREIVREAFQLYRNQGYDFCEQSSSFPDSPEWLGWEHSFGQAMFHRRLFTTVDGYFGIGPRTLIPGDRICILKGCALPLLVRVGRDHEHFQVIGECYVQGIMDGEVLEQFDRKGIRWDKIRFC